MFQRSLAATAIALPALMMSLPATAQEMVSKVSPHSVSGTIDRLQEAVETAGATVFARVDHAEGASSVDMDLRPTELLIFGNPKLGTPVMQADQLAGLDLPLRALAYADAEGVVHLVYAHPMSLADRYDVNADNAPLDQIAGALDKLTSAAVAED
ncbi:DUF302 domain-containing protein [Pseudosulfitobacter koreensis]|uniref:DUF302 domain-containing protein n=1 Tax=Pseudosulfitobacter koreensis TaxID=2968472 RepID=A0ABT1YXV4_9RHOB|nr:DUF302 domain-containing protein [Pseudosulfitobacter koreense]MCR8825722.1 DUF302 domain-containing protein [Pseudosulfitobacter koreense]